MDTLEDNSSPGENASRFFIRSFPVGPLGCNCTILGDTTTGDAIVVDPGGDVELIRQVLEEAGLSRVTQILHTHAHFDHFMGSGELHQHSQAPLCLHPDDEPLWLNLKTQCERFNLKFDGVPELHHRLSHEEELQVGKLKGEAIWTPGHSPGSMCFWFPDIQLLLAGDTLFRGGVGRTDLWGGDSTQLSNSIKQRLYVLDEAAMVIPGHGRETTIGDELRHNPFVRA